MRNSTNIMFVSWSLVQTVQKYDIIAIEIDLNSFC